MIRVDAIWLATEPMDMWAGVDSALARVVAVFGPARPHHAYCFANRREGACARRLHRGKFVWVDTDHSPHLALEPE